MEGAAVHVCSWQAHPEVDGDTVSWPGLPLPRCPVTADKRAPWQYLMVPESTWTANKVTPWASWLGGILTYNMWVTGQTKPLAHWPTEHSLGSFWLLQVTTYLVNKGSRSWDTLSSSNWIASDWLSFQDRQWLILYLLSKHLVKSKNITNELNMFKILNQDSKRNSAKTTKIPALGRPHGTMTSVACWFLEFSQEAPSQQSLFARFCQHTPE